MAAERGVFLPVHPKYMSLLLSGAKTVELRRRFPELPAGTPVVLYSTTPVRAVVALSSIRRVEVDTLEALWARFGSNAAVSRDVFDLYFDGLDRGTAVLLSPPQPLQRPVLLQELRRSFDQFTIPQNYRYVSPTWVDRLRAVALTPAA